MAVNLGILEITPLGPLLGARRISDQHPPSPFRNVCGTNTHTQIAKVRLLVDRGDDPVVASDIPVQGARDMPE